MSKKRSLSLGLAAAFAVSLAACGDSTGPGPEAVNPVETSAQLESLVTTFFTDNEGILSFAAFEPYMTDALGPSGALVSLNPQGASISTLARDARAWASQLSTSLRSGAALMSIPDALLGRTLVYDPVTAQYVVSTRTGAPPSGVRFILYAVDPITGAIVLPLVEVGYVDITATISATSARVTVKVVVNTKTLLDYSLSLVASGPSTGSLTVDGFVSDGTNVLNFDLLLTGTETSATAVFDLSAGSVRVRMELTVDEVSGSTSVLARIWHGTNGIRLELSVDAQGVVAGTVWFNGAVVASISGTEDTPVVTNATGGDLTVEELQAVGQLFLTVSEVFAVSLELVFFGLLVLG